LSIASNPLVIMSRMYINRLSDDLLIKILWHSKQPKQPISFQAVSKPSWLSMLPRPRYTSENPYGDDVNDDSSESQKLEILQLGSESAPPNTIHSPVSARSNPKSHSPLSAPPALTDPAYNLLIASICSRWRRLAQHQISMLLVKENRVVSLQDLIAAVKCFPNLSHLHLSDNSVETIDDAFLAVLASSCPKLVSLHVGKGVTSNQDFEREEEHPVTEAGLDNFFRHCTQLQHLSLYCLHRYGKLPASLSQLTHLRTLALTDVSALVASGFTSLTSLAALCVDISDQDELDLANLAHLPAFASLSLCEASWLILEGVDSHPFAFGQLASLESLEFDRYTPRFDLLFPSGSPCSRLERLVLKGCDGLVLPEDIGERLPCLRDLSICGCENFSELPEQFSSLICLQKLSIFLSDMVSLPETFGKLPALTALTLHHLQISHLPDSFYQLTSLETLKLSHCNAIFEFPPRFGQLSALRFLLIMNSPYLALPDDIGGLTNLHTFKLHENFPQQLLPSSFTSLSSLTKLELVHCMVAELPEDIRKLSSLQELSIESCSKIQKLPETVADLPSLEILRVSECSSLSLFPSLSSLAGLRELALGKFLQLPDVSNSLPHSLEVLSVGGFQRLTPLLEIPALPRLRRLSLTSVGLIRGVVAGMTLSSLEHLELLLAGEAEELPFPLKFLPNLRTLTIQNAGRMNKLPADIGSALQRLRQLQIQQALELTELPETVSGLQCLTSMEIHAPKLATLPDSLGGLSRLRKLNLSDCASLTQLPASLTQLSCLHELNLRNTPMRSLPCNFAQLSRLKDLDLHGCKQLQGLPEGFSQLKMLHQFTVTGCGELPADGIEDMYGLHIVNYLDASETLV
ncbi:hypothetical protein CLOM_g18505, partial [Closterium sp. NIES-68]